MVRVALVNMNYYRSQSGRALLDIEPVHLLAMHNICRRAGHDSRIFQNGLHPLGDVRRYRPQVLGLSFIGHSPEAIADARALVRSLPTPKPMLLLGGTDIRQYCGEYQTAFSQYYPYSTAEGLRPMAIMVQGPGEHLVQALADHEFDFSPAFDQLSRVCRKKIGHHWVGPGMLVDGNVYILDELSGIPLNDQLFERDYDLAQYGHSAQVKWEDGCSARCDFCCNVAGRIDYVSPERAVAETRALIAQGAKKIRITGANFTARPREATAIIQALVDNFSDSGVVFDFESRVDTLFAAVNLAPETWRRFCRLLHHIELGVEAFLPSRLTRLGKYNHRHDPQARAEEQPAQVEFLLQFFSGTGTHIIFFLINFDWQMTFNEAEREGAIMLDLLQRFPWTMRLLADNIFSVLHYSPGSRLAETMSPIDYFRFQDPRLLLLALYLKAKGAQLDKDSTESISFVHLINGRILAELYCQALKVINTLPKDSFDLAAALDHKTVSHKTLKRLARQLGFWRGRRLLAELDQIFNRLWANKKALTKEFAVRMLEERLPAIPESQSLKDAFMQVLRNRGLL